MAKKAKAAAKGRGAKPAPAKAAKAGKAGAARGGKKAARGKAPEVAEVAKAKGPKAKRHALIQKPDVIAKAAGASVPLSGDKAHGLYQVDSGRAHIRLTTQERNFILQSLNEGDVFFYSGGSGLESGSVDLHMLEASEVAFVPMSRLRKGDTAVEVLDLQQKQSQSYVSRLRDLALGTTDYRLAKFLYDQIPDAHKASRKSVNVQLDVSREEIAALIGTVREVVSRGLSKLVADGVIKKQGRNFSVLKLKELQKRAQLK